MANGSANSTELRSHGSICRLPSTIQYVHLLAILELRDADSLSTRNGGHSTVLYVLRKWQAMAREVLWHRQSSFTHGGCSGWWFLRYGISRSGMFVRPRMLHSSDSGPLETSFQQKLTYSDVPSRPREDSLPERTPRTGQVPIHEATCIGVLQAR